MVQHLVSALVGTLTFLLANVGYWLVFSEEEAGCRGRGITQVSGLPEGSGPTTVG